MVSNLGGDGTLRASRHMRKNVLSECTARASVIRHALDVCREGTVVLDAGELAGDSGGEGCHGGGENGCDLHGVGDGMVWLVKSDGLDVVIPCQAVRVAWEREDQAC